MKYEVTLTTEAPKHIVGEGCRFITHSVKVQMEAESEADALHQLDRFVLPGNKVMMTAILVQRKRTELLRAWGGVSLWWGSFRRFVFT